MSMIIIIDIIGLKKQKLGLILWFYGTYILIDFQIKLIMEQNTWLAH